MAAVLLACGALCAFAEGQFRRLPVAVFRDKMQGAWLGQTIGAAWGQPSEFKVKGAIIPEDKMPAWRPEMVNQHNNHDLNR